jgi:hypothetical protein
LVDSFFSSLGSHPQAPALAIRALGDHDRAWDVDDLQLAFQLYAQLLDFHGEVVEAWRGRAALVNDIVAHQVIREVENHSTLQAPSVDLLTQ